MGVSLMNSLQKTERYSAGVEEWRRKCMEDLPRAQQVLRLREILSDDPDLENILLLVGWRVLCRYYWRTARKSAPPSEKAEVRSLRRRIQKREYERWRAEDEAERQATEQKVAAFDKMVEMLDHLTVGNKALGDCSRADLVREATRIQGMSEELSVRAAFYMRLSRMIGSGTVREAQDRAKIVGLITTTFREEEAAA